MPTEAILRIRAARVAGDSLRRIADSLNADAVPAVQGGTRWYAATVKAVLDSTDEAPSLAGCGDPQRWVRGRVRGDGDEQAANNREGNQMDEHAWIAATIAAQLKDIRGTTGSLVVNLGDQFYQMASHEADAVLIETVANEFLSSELRLGPGQEQRLLQLGFTQPSPDMPNWWIGMEEGLDEEIAQAASAVATALVEVYGIPVDTLDAALELAATPD